MKIKNVAKYCCAVMAFGVLCGCETMTVPPKAPSGSKDPPTDNPQRYNLKSATSKLMSEMLSSVAFKRNYANIVDRTKGRPIVVSVGKIEPELNDKHPDCEAVRDIIQSSLNESGLFVVIMDGFESAVDYRVTGYIKSDDDDNPTLHLNILDVNGDENGKIIWSGKYTI